MIRAILAFALVAAALAAGHLLIDEKGYVLIAFNNTTIEGTIVAFVIMFVLGFIALWLVFKLLKTLLRMYGKTTGFWRSKKALKAQQVWQQGLWASINDDAAAVQSTFNKGQAPEEWQDAQQALLAKAALQQGDKAQALAHLQNISDSAQSKVPKLWLDANQNEQALALLDAPMAEKKPTQAAVSSYLAGLLQAEKHAELATAINQHYKRLDWSQAQWQAFMARWFAANAEQAIGQFEQLPKALKVQSEAIYMQSQASAGQWQNLLPTLQKWLKKGQYQAFADVVVHAKNPDVKLRSSLQDALKKHPEQPQLLFAMGCLANAAGEYELAAKVFDNCQLTELDKAHLKPVLNSYEQTQQFQKAYLLLAAK
jgi:HemY protein